MALISVLADVEFVHNGAEDEFTWAWDAETGVLTFGGFRRVDGTLSQIYLIYSLIDTPEEYNYYTIYVSDDMDSNDIYIAITDFLSGLYYGATLEVVQYTPASCSGTFTLEVTYQDFGNLVPAPALSTDGSCQWELMDTAIVDIPLAVVTGISAARSRLVAWDRENAIYRSASIDPLDFTPSLATQANVGKAAAVRGNIIHIAGHNDGYTVYSTGNVVAATYTGDDFVFNYAEIAGAGISDPRHFAGDAERHFFYGALGLQTYVPAKKQVAGIDASMDVYLAKVSWPITLWFLEGRYLCVGIPCLRETDRYLRANRGIADKSVFPPPVSPIVIPSIWENIPNWPENPGEITSFPRVLVFDTSLNKWGSCDVGALTMVGFTPINASGLRADRVVRNNDEGWRTNSSGLGFVMPDMHLHLATATRVDSKVFIGPTQFQRTGYSNLIALRLRNAPYVNPLGEYTVRVGTYDSDWQLDRVVNTYVHTALLSASEVEIPFDITAMAFDVQITGQFDLQLVRLTGLAGAKF